MPDNDPTETQELPPHADCHFWHRKPEDIVREQKEIVYEVLDNRPLSRKEEGVIKEVAGEIIQIALDRHKAGCEKERIKQKIADDKEAKQSGRDWVGIIINIISMLIALSAVLYAILSKGATL